MPSDKAVRFVDEMMIDMSQSAAAIRAGYANGGVGSTLMQNSAIVNEINRRKLERSNQLEIDAKWVLKRLADETNADLNDIYYETGELKPVHEWPIMIGIIG